MLAGGVAGTELATGLTRVEFAGTAVLEVTTSVCPPEPVTVTVTMELLYVPGLLGKVNVVGGCESPAGVTCSSPPYGGAAGAVAVWVTVTLSVNVCALPP